MRPFRPILPLCLISGSLLSLAGIVNLGMAAKTKTTEKPAPAKTSKAKEKAEASEKATPAAAPTPLDYNFQIRPILANACFKCHGSDQKALKGKLRLDLEQEAYARVIKPGNVGRERVLETLGFTRSRGGHAATGITYRAEGGGP